MPNNPLYTKAPLLLTRFPVLLIGLVLGVMLLAVVIAAFPLGLSAAGSRFLQGEVRKGVATRYGVGINYQNENVRLEGKLYERQEALFEREMSRLEVLDETLTSIRGPLVSVEAGGDGRDGRLFYRENHIHHVELLAGEPGLLVADSVADPLGIGPGESITLKAGRSKVTVRVDGIYAALYREAPTGFWRPWRQSIYPPCPGDPGTSGCTPPPAFVLADEKTVLELSEALGERGAVFGFDAPLKNVGTFTLEDARELESDYQDLARRMAAPGTELHDVFLCCGHQYIREERYLTETRLSSVVPQILSQAEQRLDAAEVPGRLLQIIAIAVATAAVFSAALYSFAARRTEVSLFHARGFSPTEIGVKTSLESLVPATFAGVLGWVLTRVLVGIMGGDISPGSVKAAALGVAAAVPCTVVGIGTVSGVLFHRWRVLRETGSTPNSPRVLGEVAIVTGAALMLARATTSPVEIGWVSVLTPIAVLSACAVIAARLLTIVLTSLRSLPLPQAVHLAVARASVARIGVLLFGLATLFFGTFQQGLTIARSLEETVVAKSLLFVGSDVGATTAVGDQPPKLPWPVTTAWRIPHAAAAAGEVDIVAIDPATVADAAYWNERFGAPTLATLVETLEDSRAELPSIATGEFQGPIEVGGTQITPTVVAEVEAFAGMLSHRPTIVVTQQDLTTATEGSGLLSSSQVTAEWWLRGNPDEISTALPRLEEPPYSIITAREVRDIPYIATTIATFKLLDLLGIIGGGLVIVASLAYLQSAERSRAVSSQLGIRMGASVHTLIAAAVMELALFVVVGYVVAIAPATLTARVLAGKLDPLDTIPPGVLFSVPLEWISVGALVTATAVGLGGVAVARRALKADMASLMRIAE